MLDRIGIDTGQGFHDVRTRGDDFRIYEELAVRAVKYRDIPASAQQSCDIAAKGLHGDLCCGGFFEGVYNKGVFLCKKQARSKTSYRRRNTSGGNKVAP
jgi:hypothetical protein